MVSAAQSRHCRAATTGALILTVRVKVTPRSASSEVVGVLGDGTLKVRLVAAPEKGKANAELCRVLASIIQWRRVR